MTSFPSGRHSSPSFFADLLSNPSKSLPLLGDETGMDNQDRKHCFLRLDCDQPTASRAPYSIVTGKGRGGGGGTTVSGDAILWVARDAVGDHPNSDRLWTSIVFQVWLLDWGPSSSASALQGVELIVFFSN